MSPRIRSERPVASVTGSRRPPADEDPVSLLSPEAQSRNLRSPKMAPKAPVKAVAKAASRASQMSPVDAYRPFNDFQPFSAAQSRGYGQQSQPAPTMKATSSKAQSRRAPSVLDTIPNEYTGDGAFARSERARDANTYADTSEAGGFRADERMNGYARPRQHGRSVSGTSRGGMSQPAPISRDYGRMDGMDARQARSKALSPVLSQPNTLRTNAEDTLQTPTQTRPGSPDEELNDYETEIVQGILSARTPRTSIAPSMLAEELKRTHYHDEDLCILLHAADNEMQHEIVRKALRKAVAARIKKLGLKSDREVSMRNLALCNKFPNYVSTEHQTIQEEIPRPRSELACY